MKAPPAGRHRPSHQALIDRIPGQATRRDGRLDAIVVASARPANRLRAAVELATTCQSSLVVLVSDAGEGSIAAEQLGRESSDSLAVAHVPNGYEHPWTAFASSAHAEAGATPYPDLSTKRNIALLLARLVGWRRLLLLDDDIEHIDPALVRVACAALGGRYRAIGFKVAEHPDNSVACHAARLAGQWQDTFLGANALLLDTTTTLPCFPAVYNEDWCFLCPLLRRRNVAQVGTAWQLPYDPYDAPARAVAQEFGDVLGEGLLSLVHMRAWSSGTDPAYWRARLEGRRAFLDANVEVLSENHRSNGPAIAALGAARDRLEAISPSACATFVGDVVADASKWEDRVKDLPSYGSVSRALGALELAVR